MRLLGLQQHSCLACPGPSRAVKRIHDTISASTDSSVPQVPQRSAWTSSGWSVITARRTCSCSGPRLAKHYRLGKESWPDPIIECKKVSGTLQTHADALSARIPYSVFQGADGGGFPPYSPSAVLGACHGRRPGFLTVGRHPGPRGSRDLVCLSEIGPSPGRRLMF